MSPSISEVNPQNSPPIIKEFESKLRFYFEGDRITEIVLISPSSESSLVITAISGSLRAVHVPFNELKS